MLYTDIPSSSKDLLHSNVRDEEKHDLALSLISDAHGIDEKAEKEAGTTRCMDCASGSHGTQSNGCRACNFLLLLPAI